MPRQPKHYALSAVLNQARQIKKSHLLRKMMATTVSRDSIEKRVEECLPSALKGKFLVADLSNKQLTLHCSSASLATRFRFEQDTFLAALKMRIGASKVNQIKIQIRPNARTSAVNKTVKVRERKELDHKTTEQRLEGVLERLGSRSNNKES